MSTYQIYLLTNRVNGKRYVGLTSETATGRFREHVREFRRQNPKSKHYALYRAFARHGPESFDLCVLHDAVPTLAEAREKEREEIARLRTYRTEYNMTLGGEGSLGHVWTEAQKRARSEAYSGGRHPGLGRKRPDTAARLLRDNPMKRPSVAKASGDRQRGVPKKPEANEKISIKLKSLWAAGAVRGWTGRRHTPETRVIMRAAAFRQDPEKKRGDRNPAKRADVRAKMSASAKKRTMRAALARAGGCLSFLDSGKFEMHGVRPDAVVAAPLPA